MVEIEFLKYRLRGELSSRIDDSDIVEILEVLQLTEEVIEKLKRENEWLYGKLNNISEIIENGRREVL
jgi:hypothetical protein